jgi:SAM-dependent methyltransferase
MKCRLCNAEQNQNIRAENVFGGTQEHKFYECSECGVIYLNPPLSEQEEEYFYKKEFEKFMSKRVGDHRDWSNAEKHVQTNKDQILRRWKFLEPHLANNKDILEIGCSSGFMMEAFRNYGLKTVGIEPSGEFLDFLHQKGFEAYEDLKHLPEKKFDLIVHFFVFEHIRDPFDFLKSTFEMLNDGGVIVAEIPSATDPLTYIFNIPAFENFYWSIAHHYYYTPKSLKFILDKLGYKYELIPEQRYDISNHITWLMNGKPGGQNRFKFISSRTIESYKQDLKDAWLCDTIFLKIYKN